MRQLAPPATDLTLSNRIERWARLQPDATAYLFIDSNLEVTQSLTYRELWSKVGRFASRLHDRGVRHQDRVALIFDSGGEFVVAFLATLLCGAIAVPLAPMMRRNEDFWRRFERVLDDCAPAAVVLGSSYAWAADQKCRFTPTTFDAIASALGSPGHWTTTTPVDGTGLAILQYTSGSTGHPKGVMVSHSNLMANSQGIYDAFGHSFESRIFTWLPHYHDMGLVGGLLQAIYGGFMAVVMSPTAFIQRPLRWLQGVAKFGCTVSGAPNFAYEAVLRRAKTVELEHLELSSWKVAFVGAEPISVQSLDAFASRFEANGFRRSALFPCYGMAEATLMATGGHTLESRTPAIAELHGGWAGRQRYAGCGTMIPGHELCVVDPANMETANEGVIGEAWLRGPSVAAGYWNRPAETGAVFDQLLAGKRGYFRTGDLGFMSNGQWHPAGRLKEIVIVRGKNFSSTDLEAIACQAHPQIQPGGAAALGLHDGGREQFILLVEVHRNAMRGAQPADIARRANASLLAAFGISPDQIRILPHGALPRTTSGKIARSICRDAWREGVFDSRPSTDQGAELSADAFRPTALQPAAPSG